MPLGSAASDTEASERDTAGIALAAPVLVAFAQAQPIPLESDGNNRPPHGPPELSDDAPTWLRQAISYLTEVPLGPYFDALLAALVSVEAAYGYAENPTRGLPKDGRPEIVNTWIWGGRGQRSKTRHEIKDLKAFIQSWDAWWASIQPPWRRKDAQGRYIIGKYGEDWDCLDYPGQNGTLSVVAALYFWGTTRRPLSELPKNAQDEWEAAVQDVSWMLEGLAAWALV
ncbi:hypothetical protein B0H15DRAFT_791504 [Mycena belliarum]|uniref:Uncharacterized protein n=1 Tax=Mycena belliarum TaxID=1033014 RepID=A0AAD6XMJ8_9AGAR|nr:hypothetical protein B0H15DRAFT_791504 [Mycena belliae]